MERKRDVFGHGHMRPDGVGLKHHADVALVRRHEQPFGGHDHGLIAEKNIARVGMFQTGDHAQRRGLAAAARTEQGEDLAVVNVEGKILHRRFGCCRVGFPQAAQADGDFGSIFGC